MNVQGTNFHKIGISKDPENRRWCLDCGPIPVVLVQSQEVSNARDLEAELHRYFSSRRVRGEWFEISLDELLPIYEAFVTMSIVDSTFDEGREPPTELRSRSFLVNREKAMAIKDLLDANWKYTDIQTALKVSSATVAEVVKDRREEVLS